MALLFSKKSDEVMSEKSLKKNISLNLFYQIFLIITPFITAPYLSRVLEADGIGVCSYTTSIQAFFALFAVLGKSSYGLREIARCRDDRAELSRTFWEIELLSVITSLICIAIWIVFALHSDSYEILFLILTINFLFSVFDISWFYAGLEEFKYTIIRNIIFKLLGIILIFVFVRQKSDVWIFVLINSVSNALGALSMWLYLRNFLIKFSIRELRVFRHLKETLVYFVPTISSSVYTYLDKAMIGGITHDEFENGYYEQATKIISIAKSIGVYAVTGVMGSRMAYMFKVSQKKEILSVIEKSFDFILLLSIGLCFGIFAVADYFVPVFFGNGYERTVPVLQILCPIVVIVGISNCLGTHYYTPAGFRGKSSVFIIIASVCNLIFNCIFIPLYGSFGAAFGSVLAELIVAALYFAFCKGYCTLKVLIKLSWKKVCAGLIMLVALRLMVVRLMPSIIGLILVVGTGIAVYFLVLFILRDSALISQLKNVFRGKMV